MRKLLVILLMFSPILAISQNWDDVVFAITPQEKLYLRYFQFENSFDSVSINYRIGEFRIIHNNNTEQIKPAQVVDESKRYWGNDTPGIDLTLQAIAKTENFIMPSSGTLTFHRWLIASLDCDKEYEELEIDRSGKGDWRDDWWLVGQNRISDRTEFVLQLVKASDNSVVAVLDSVGVGPNPNSDLAPRYGNNPTKMNHSVQLPTGFEDIVCYLRISPRRWGLTSYAMKMQIFPNWFSFSHFMEYDSSGVFKYSMPLIQESFDSCYKKRFLDYCESERAEKGYLPNQTGLPLRADLDSILLARYYSEPTQFEFNGDFVDVYEEIIDTSLFKKSLYEFNTKDKFENQSATITAVYPMPGNVDIISIDINSFFESDNLKLVVASLSGKNISILPIVTVREGFNQLRININDFYNGTYFLVLKDENEKILDIKKFIVNK